MDFFEKKDKNEVLFLSNGKNSSSQNFLNKKRFRMDKGKKDIKIQSKQNEKKYSFNLKNPYTSQNFLDKFTQILNFSKVNFRNYFLNERNKFFNSTFNLKLINNIINYFSKEESSLRNVNIFNYQDLIDIIKTFLINEFEFSIFTFLINKFIFIFPNILGKESIQYLGLYTKYISCSEFTCIFHDLIYFDESFRKFFLQYKDFLIKLDINFTKINKGSDVFMSYNHNLDMLDFNSMIDNLFSSKEEKESENNNNKIINPSIGKKMNVVIVYREESTQENTNYIETGDSSHNENEVL